LTRAFASLTEKGTARLGCRGDGRFARFVLPSPTPHPALQPARPPRPRPRRTRSACAHTRAQAHTHHSPLRRGRRAARRRDENKSSLPLRPRTPATRLALCPTLTRGGEGGLVLPFTASSEPGRETPGRARPVRTGGSPPSVRKGLQNADPSAPRFPSGRLGLLGGGGSRDFRAGHRGGSGRVARECGCVRVIPRGCGVVCVGGAAKNSGPDAVERCGWVGEGREMEREGATDTWAGPGAAIFFLFCFQLARRIAGLSMRVGWCRPSTLLRAKATGMEAGD
jgi:hypothetical protein